jgi:HD-like signal output (HDOD) protein
MAKALQSPTASTQSIADIAARDPGLTAKLLQLSNSAFFGINRTVNSVADAVQFLGVGVIQSLALAVPLFSSFDRNKCPSFPVEQVWHHSIQTGILARWLVGEYLEDSVLAEQAFAAGVLHDIGQLILAQGMSKDYSAVLAEVRSNATPLCQVEQNRFQTTHAEVGGYLLTLWGLPFSLVDAVAYHHDPRRSPTATFGLAGIIHVVNLLQHEQTIHPGFVPTPMDMEYIHSHGLEGYVDKWREDLRSGTMPSLA